MLFVAAAAFLATLAGGLLALRFSDQLHLILGFSAGAIIGVAFFELLPEALELSEGHYQPSTLLALTAMGFGAFLVADRLAGGHRNSAHVHADGAGHEHGAHGHGHAQAHTHSIPSIEDAGRRGAIGAGSLSAHSLLDGIAIGVAFQASTAVGLVVAAAVLMHDFSDGMNTVNIVLKNGGKRSTAFRWLLADAAAPVIGILLSLAITLPPGGLGLLLAGFAGFFIYIGASDLIPESYHAHPKWPTTMLTLLGFAAIFGVTRLAEHAG